MSRAQARITCVEYREVREQTTATWQHFRDLSKLFVAKQRDTRKLDLASLPCSCTKDSRAFDCLQHDRCKCLMNNFFEQDPQRVACLTVPKKLQSNGSSEGTAINY